MDDGLVAEVVLVFDHEGSVVLEFGGAGAGDLGHLVEPSPGEADLVGALINGEAGLHGPEGDLAFAIGPNDQGRRSAKVELVAVPEIRLDDAPAPDDRVLRGLHGA